MAETVQDYVRWIKAMSQQPIVDELLAQCASRGLLVNNLFQLDSGHWQANLRCAAGAFEWAQGASAGQALAAALAVAAGGPEPFYKPPAQSAKTAEELGL